MENQYEKRAFDHTAALCCGGVLLYHICVSLVYKGAEQLMYAWSHGSSGVSSVQVQFLNLCITLIPILAVVAALKWATREEAYKPLPRCKHSFIRMAGCFVPVFITVSLISGLFFSWLFGYDNSEFFSPPHTVPAAIIGFFTVCVLPAVGEELLFRGMMQRYMQGWGSAVAILGPAVLFGLLHGSPAQICNAILAGIMLGLLMEVTGSLPLCMLVHFCNNLLAYIGILISDGFTAMIFTALQLCIPVCAVAALAIAVKQKWYKSLVPLRKGDGLRLLLTSPPYLLVTGGLLLMVVGEIAGGL